VHLNLLCTTLSCSADVPGLLHGIGHAKRISHLSTVVTGELDAAKSNAANLVAQLRVETADKQQLSTKLADSETIKTELEGALWLQQLLSWDHKLFDHPLSVKTNNATNHNIK